MTSIAADPLPSWREGPSKAAILAFVAQVSQEGSPDFIPLAERIAVVDNDGTLWPEHPLPFQAAFAIDELQRTLLSDHLPSEWPDPQQEQPAPWGLPPGRVH